MPVAVDFSDANGYAQQYREAVKDLNRHWLGEDGACVGCGDSYPCAEEWITQRAITGIETRWRREARRLDNLRQGHDRAAADAAGNEGSGETV